jgi:hypothetical protein
LFSVLVFEELRDRDIVNEAIIVTQLELAGRSGVWKVVLWNRCSEVTGGGVNPLLLRFQTDSIEVGATCSPGRTKFAL